MAKRISLAGQRFGRLVALEPAPNRGKRTMWLCRCDCGATHVAASEHLVGGRIVSCGCFHRERQRSARTHGLTHSPEYVSWLNMRARCRNRNHPSWPDYGGRGITICDRWDSFESFFADMGSRPDGSSIERLDVDGNYEPGNCVWASKRVQSRNTRANRSFTHDGRTLPLVDWCELQQIPYWTVHARLRRGWSFARALGFEQ